MSDGRARHSRNRAAQCRRTAQSGIVTIRKQACAPEFPRADRALHRSAVRVLQIAADTNVRRIPVRVSSSLTLAQAFRVAGGAAGASCCRAAQSESSVPALLPTASAHRSRTSQFPRCQPDFSQQQHEIVGRTKTPMVKKLHCAFAALEFETRLQRQHLPHWNREALRNGNPTLLLRTRFRRMQGSATATRTFSLRSAGSLPAS